MGHARIRGSRGWVTARGHPALQTNHFSVVRYVLVKERTSIYININALNYKLDKEHERISEVSGVSCTDCSMENRGNLSALFGESVIGDVELYLGCSSAERHASRYRRSVRRGGEAP